MTAKKWKSKIKKNCIEAGTYKKVFDAVIDTLADILEKRDNANEQFIESGGFGVVAHTNKNGSTNMEQNPLIRLVNDLNRDALAYWKELGLTPAALRKLNEAAMQPEKKLSFLEQALADIG